MLIQPIKVIRFHPVQQNRGLSVPYCIIYLKIPAANSLTPVCRKDTFFLQKIKKIS